MTGDYRFRKAPPENVGIRSGAITNFLKEAEREHLQLHAIMISRKDRLIAEGYWKPYAADKVQRICSAGKAVVATAVLFALAERRFSLRDTAAKLFPDQTPPDIDAKAAAITVYDLLTMHAGHRTDSFAYTASCGEEVWSQFLKVPVIDEPGTKFFYDNGIPDVLAGLVRKTTGETINSYLKSRLWDPLQIRDVRIETGRGYEELATFCMSTASLMKLTLFYLHDGYWNGEQLLPPELVRKARSWQVPLSGIETELHGADRYEPEVGYGFQIWKSLGANFVLNGGCGQLGIGFPEFDLAIAVQADEPRSDRIEKLLWQNLRGNIYNRPLAEDQESYRELEERLQNLTLMEECGDEKPEIPEPGARCICTPRTMIAGIEKLEIAQQGDCIELKFNGSQSIELPTDGSWTACRIPVIVPETGNDGEHRKSDHGVRLDTNVGYDTGEGYAAIMCRKNLFRIHFTSDAWLGEHIISVEIDQRDPDAGSCVISHENGTSFRLAACPRELMKDQLKSCIHREYTAGGVTWQS